MAPSVPIHKLADMNAEELFECFCKYARYVPGGPTPYTIRLGSSSLFSDDTADLRAQFDQAVNELRNARRRGMSEKDIRVGMILYHAFNDITGNRFDYPIDKVEVIRIDRRRKPTRFYVAAVGSSGGGWTCTANCLTKTKPRKPKP